MIEPARIEFAKAELREEAPLEPDLEYIIAVGEHLAELVWNRAECVDNDAEALLILCASASHEHLRSLMARHKLLERAP